MRTRAVLAALVLVGAEALAESGSWEYAESIDVMDDSRHVVAVSPTTDSEALDDQVSRAALRVGCVPPQRMGGDEVVFEATMYVSRLGLDGERGRVRFDEAPPVIAYFVSDDSGDFVRLSLPKIDKTLGFQRSSFSPVDPREVPDRWLFVERLLDSHRVLVELPQHGRNPVFRFTLNADDKALIRRVVSECQVSESTGRPWWRREGKQTVLAERRVRPPKYRMPGDRWVPVQSKPPRLNTVTGEVMFPYDHGDVPVSVNVNGKPAEFTSSSDTPWEFQIPTASFDAAEGVEIVYQTRTTDGNTLDLRGGFERTFKLTFPVTDSERAMYRATREPSR